MQHLRQVMARRCNLAATIEHEESLRRQHDARRQHASRQVHAETCGLLPASKSVTMHRILLRVACPLRVPAAVAEVRGSVSEPAVVPRLAHAAPLPAAAHHGLGQVGADPHVDPAVREAAALALLADPLREEAARRGLPQHLLDVPLPDPVALARHPAGRRRHLGHHRLLTKIFFRDLERRGPGGRRRLGGLGGLAVGGPAGPARAAVLRLRAGGRRGAREGRGGDHAARPPGVGHHGRLVLRDERRVLREHHSHGRYAPVRRKLKTLQDSAMGSPVYLQETLNTAEIWE
mmetsp:Transcript_65627/g.171955  ORF Transcript_65627/g.171955 Transcript_65627/m.171955 type:complete len:290 (-) Transcript_65627:31-900(-)